MQGYFENPEATAEALRDGWLHTGDLGYLAGGQLFVCGRTKDLIIRQGRKYHPADLEAAIADLPGMRPSGAVVFAISRIEDEDEVVAVVDEPAGPEERGACQASALALEPNPGHAGSARRPDAAEF